MFDLGNWLVTNMMYVVGVLLVSVIIMYAFVINIYLNLSYLKKRYHKMMTGVDGANLERMLIGHIDETKAIAEENKRLKGECKRLDDLLQLAITRVGVVRFCAFEDMGSDLSYAVALLDSHDDGVVLSSIFGREDSRGYVKPIKGGKSKYALTQEEEQALAKAMKN